MKYNYRYLREVQDVHLMMLDMFLYLMSVTHKAMLMRCSAVGGLVGLSGACRCSFSVSKD